MPTSLNSGSMPNVRASSGMIGTIRGPSSLSRMRLRRIRLKTMVVETGVWLPAANSASIAGGGGGQRLRRGRRARGIGPPSARRRSIEVLDLLGLRAGVVVRRVLELARPGSAARAGRGRRAAPASESFLAWWVMLRASTPRAERPALDGLGEDDRRRALVLGRGLVGGVDLAVVVAAAAELGEVVVGEVLDELAEARVGPEEVLADVGAAGAPRTSGTRRRACRSSAGRAAPSTSRASRSSHSRAQMTLMTFQPAPRKTASSSWMILPLPRTGPSRRCRLQLTTKVRLSRPSRAATSSAPSDSGSSVSPSPRNAQTRDLRGVEQAAVVQVAVEARLVDGA